LGNAISNGEIHMLKFLLWRYRSFNED